MKPRQKQSGVRMKVSAVRERARSVGSEPAPPPVGLSLWSRIVLYAGSAYIAIHVGLFLAAHSGWIPVQQMWWRLPLGLWLQIVEMVAVILVAATTAAVELRRQTGHRATVAIGPWERSAAGRVPLGDAAELTVNGRPAAEVIQDLALLYEIGQGVSQTIDLQELLDRMTEVLSTHLDLREFAILLLDDDRKYLQVKAAYGFPDRARIHDMICHLGEGVSGEVARTGKPLYVHDTSRDDRYLHYHGEFQEGGSLLSVPLHYKREVLGVANFGRGRVASFTENDLRIFGLVANQIALAIANARLYSKTRELAIRDDLTGLFNRRHFQDVLNVEWKRAVRFRRNLAVLMIDVDYFKSFNDTHGHLYGDQVLRRIGELLHRNVREVDTLARFGGEEFVVLLPDTDRAGSLHVAEKLHRMVGQERFPIPGEDRHQALTISLGISVYPDDAAHMDDLIDHADIALYDAKDSGRNRMVCYPTRRESPETVMPPEQNRPLRRAESV